MNTMGAKEVAAALRVHENRIFEWASMSAGFGGACCGERKLTWQ
jgi:hypothetical protein